MSGSAPLVLGSTVRLKGDVTQNTWVGARSAHAIEDALGFERGRLAAGWAVLLLKQKLTIADFEFSGITLRSGGREGLPADTDAADKLRPRVHDRMMASYGASGYQEMQQARLSSIPPTGSGRLVKVLPTTRHDPSLAPSRQYPMGGGGLQWTLRTPCQFLVAMMVDATGIATIASTPPFAAFLGPSATYEDRARIARFLDTA